MARRCGCKTGSRLGLRQNRYITTACNERATISFPSTAKKSRCTVSTSDTTHGSVTWNCTHLLGLTTIIVYGRKRGRASGVNPHVGVTSQLHLWTPLNSRHRQGTIM